MRHVVGPAVAAIFACILANCSLGCGKPASDVSNAYVMELIGCYEKAKTKEESVGCRKEVNRRYGLCPDDGYPRINPCD